MKTQKRMTLLILILVILGAGHIIGAEMVVENEAEPDLITVEDMRGLPQPVIRHLKQAGVVGTPRIQTVYLEQTGLFKIAQDKPYSPLAAWQTYELKEPTFLWKAKMKIAPLVSVRGFDKLENGKGLLKMHLMGIIPLVSAEGEAVDQGDLMRYLSETIWFPQVFLEEMITWAPIDENRAKATLHAANMDVSGIFEFDDAGKFARFEAERYFMGKDSTRLEEWIVMVDEYGERGGLNIPTHGTVVWKLEEGDFEYISIDVNKVIYE
ncbi:MAG: hypothetical protein K9M49_03365 [Candidatus Marinimicrobia bacterium]|nr:hypothetical protein [Candidatus Neomarinimicrobiota bacterium]MCF7904173.1 hypothetical protein [Candidatus Neomarinimicrobiota bacterium]